LLTASEVAEYTFCPEAWYLRRHAVRPSPDAERRLECGARAHRRIGKATDHLRVVETARKVLLLGIVLVALVLAAHLAAVLV
jgi:hypothetical protein